MTCIPINAGATVRWIFLDNALSLIISTNQAASARRKIPIQTNVRLKFVLSQGYSIKNNANVNVQESRDEVAHSAITTLERVGV